MQSELGALNSLVIVPPKNENQEDILDTSSMKFDSVISFLFCCFCAFEAFLNFVKINVTI